MSFATELHTHTHTHTLKLGLEAEKQDPAEARGAGGEADPAAAPAHKVRPQTEVRCVRCHHTGTPHLWRVSAAVSLPPSIKTVLERKVIVPCAHS